jgi:DNA-directed RNA polymerase specialized sigma24 family protein
MVMNRADEIAAAISGEESAFGALSEGHRRELHIHGYRLASFDEAEDPVQETFLRVDEQANGPVAFPPAERPGLVARS